MDMGVFGDVRYGSRFICLTRSCDCYICLYVTMVLCKQYVNNIVEIFP